VENKLICAIFARSTTNLRIFLGMNTKTRKYDIEYENKKIINVLEND
jgi:hypothetical protein